MGHSIHQPTCEADGKEEKNDPHVSAEKHRRCHRNEGSLYSLSIAEKGLFLKGLFVREPYVTGEDLHLAGDYAYKDNKCPHPLRNFRCRLRTVLLQTGSC